MSMPMSVLKIAGFALLLGLPGAGEAVAENISKDGSGTETLNVVSECSFNGARLPRSIKIVSAPNKVHSISTVHAIVNEVSSYFGTRPDFSTRAANIENAAAVRGNTHANRKDVKRYILYNERFYYKLLKTTNSKWPAIGVFGHEIGHHLANHPLRADESASKRQYYELQADWYSGYIQGKMGATRSESALAVQKVAPLLATFTHPGKSARLAAVRNGWDTACQYNTECKLYSSSNGEKYAALPQNNSHTCKILGQQLLIKNNRLYWIKFPDVAVGRKFASTDKKDGCDYRIEVPFLSNSNAVKASDGAAKDLLINVASSGSRRNSETLCVRKNTGSVTRISQAARAKPLGTCTVCRSGLCP